MGDRCDLSLTLRGHIATIENLETVVDEISIESGHDQQELYQLIRKALEDEDNPTFKVSEVNYGQIEDLENTLKALKISFDVTHGEGGGYPGGTRAYDSSDGSYTEGTLCHGDSVLYLHAIKKLLASDDPLEDIKSLIASHTKSCGVGLPQFSVSHEVRGWLTIGGPSLTSKE